MTDEEFVNIIREEIYLSVDDSRELADELGVSLPTVVRWSKGKNLPGQSLREAIRKYLFD